MLRTSPRRKISPLPHYLCNDMIKEMFIFRLSFERIALKQTEHQSWCHLHHVGKKSKRLTWKGDLQYSIKTQEVMYASFHMRCLFIHFISLNMNVELTDLLCTLYYVFTQVQYAPVQHEQNFFKSVLFNNSEMISHLFCCALVFPSTEVQVAAADRNS